MAMADKCVLDHTCPKTGPAATGRGSAHHLTGYRAGAIMGESPRFPPRRGRPRRVRQAQRGRTTPTRPRREIADTKEFRHGRSRGRPATSGPTAPLAAAGPRPGPGDPGGRLDGLATVAP